MKRLISLVIVLALSQAFIQAQTPYVISVTHNETGTLHCSAKIENYALDNCIIATGCAGIHLPYKDYQYCISHGIITEKDYECDVMNRTALSTLYRGKKYKVRNFYVGNFLIHDVSVTFDIFNKEGYMRLIGMELFNNFSSVTINLKENKILLTR